MLNPSKLMQTVLQLKAGDPILGLVQKSPGWKQQQVAQLLLSKNWGEDPWSMLASDTVGLFYSYTNAGQFSNAGKLSSLQTIEIGRRELT